MKIANNMTAVFITVFTGFIGLSLPYPVFSHLFLSADSTLIPLNITENARALFLGAAIAFFPIGQAVASPIWGKWSDRYGRKRILIFSLAFASTGMLVTAFAINLDMLYLLFLGRLVSGLGEGNIAIAQAMASDADTKDQKTKNMAAISIAINAGWIVGPLLGGLAGDSQIASFTGPTLPFWIATVMYLLNMVIIYGLIQADSKQTILNTRVEGVDFLTLLSNGAFRVIIVLTLICFFGTYVMFSFFGPYLVQTFNVTSAKLGLCAALLSIPLILAGICAGKIHQRLGVMKMTILGLTLLAGGLALLVLPDDLAWLVIPATITAFGIVILEVTTAIMVSDVVSRKHQGQAMGVYRSAIVIAEIMAALAGGWLAGYIPQAPFLLAGIVVASGLPLVISKIRRKIKPRLLPGRQDFSSL